MDDVTTLTSDKVDSCFLYNILKKKVLCNPTVQYKYVQIYCNDILYTSSDVCLQMENTTAEKSCESK